MGGPALPLCINAAKAAYPLWQRGAPVSAACLLIRRRPWNRWFQGLFPGGNPPRRRSPQQKRRYAACTFVVPGALHIPEHPSGDLLKTALIQAELLPGIFCSFASAQRRLHIHNALGLRLYDMDRNILQREQGSCTAGSSGTAGSPLHGMLRPPPRRTEEGRGRGHRIGPGPRPVLLTAGPGRNRRRWRAFPPRPA